MKRVLRRNVVVAIVVATTAVAGVGYAAIPDAAGVIHACRSNVNGSSRVIDTANEAECKPRESALSWGQSGAPGPQGPEGPAGPKGEKGDAGTADVAGFGSALASPLELDNGVSVVVSKALDAGNYMLFATAEVIGAGTAGAYQGGYSPVACWIPGYKTDTYYLAPNGATYTGGGQVTMSLTSVVAHAGGDLALECRANWGNPSHVRRASLSAIKVSRLG